MNRKWRKKEQKKERTAHYIHELFILDDIFALEL